jgi:hypothetical protein
MRTFVFMWVGLAVCSAGKAEVLTGVVLQENGKPAPGATITADAVFKSPPLRRMTKADDQGAFQIDLPKVSGSQRYVLAVRWKMQGAKVGDTLDKDGQTTSIQGQALPPVSVRLSMGGDLNGRLLQTEDDKPISGARLYLDTGEVLTTNARGEFHVSGLPMRDHSLIPVAPGRVRQYVLFDTTKRLYAELELRLPRGAVIQGKITNEEGKPIPGAYLTRSSSGTALTLNGWNEVCQPDGSFEYGGLSSKRLFYSLEARAPGYVAEEVSSEVKNSTQVIVRNIQLKKKQGELADSSPMRNVANAKQEPTALPRRTVGGTVRDETGSFVEGAQVRWGAFLWDRSVKPTKTDKAGRFALKSVPVGQGAVLVIADGFAPQFASFGTKDRPLGSELEVVLSSGKRYLGIVCVTTGHPVSGVSIVPDTNCM